MNRADITPGKTYTDRAGKARQTVIAVDYSDGQWIVKYAENGKTGFSYLTKFAQWADREVK